MHSMSMRQHSARRLRPGLALLAGAAALVIAGTGAANAQSSSGSSSSGSSGIAGSGNSGTSNSVAGSGQTGRDRPLSTTDRGRAIGTGGSSDSNAERASPAPTGSAGNPIPNESGTAGLGESGSPTNKDSDPGTREQGAEGQSITGGSITRDGASGLPK